MKQRIAKGFSAQLAVLVTLAGVLATGAGLGLFFRAVGQPSSDLNFAWLTGILLALGVAMAVIGLTVWRTIRALDMVIYQVRAEALQARADSRLEAQRLSESQTTFQSAFRAEEQEARERLRSDQDRLDLAVDALAQSLSARARLEEVKGISSGVRDDLMNEINDLQEKITSGTSQELTNALQEITKVRASLGDMHEKGAQASASLETKLTQATTRIQNVEQSLKTVTERLSKLDRHVKDNDRVLATRSSAETVKHVRTIADRAFDRATDARNRIVTLEHGAKKHHVHQRFLTPDDVEVLLDDWAAPLGVELTRASLRYHAERIKILESQCQGRLATDLQTMLVRCLAARSIRREQVNITEIGVLFGVGAGCLYDTCRFRNQDVQLTLIDPLKGYYDRADLDIITRVAVTREVLLHNLAHMSVPNAAFRLVQAMSETPEALNTMTPDTIDLLVIDGDHSYEGVKRDFENYRPFMRQGGLIVFDDYDTEDWPEIQTYVDKEIIPDPHLDVIATGFRTALVRVTSSAQG
ncbi:MAG: class I SAM-dependent methyltransferase [Pseudomonadota bacterium]